MPASWYANAISISPARSPACARSSVICAASVATESSSGVRVVFATSPVTGKGIHPCARCATRRRVSLELPPIHTGIGPVGAGLAITSRALKWRPS